MSRIFASLCLFCAISLFAPRSASAVAISWSPVGNPGNAPDPTTGYGAVGSAYKIGTFDVTNSQYVAFLNAKDPTGANALGLYNVNMSAQYGGIDFTAGHLNGSKYSVISGTGNQPVTWGSWYDAIRFANWLNNGQGTADTETGAYTLGSLGAGGVPINGASITRNADAKVFLPSLDEWYKAAYYNPTNKTYFLYPTGSNTVPTDSSPTALPNHANFIPGGPLNPTNVGAYTGTTSPYGAFDMGGNVFQWDETLVQDANRESLGGSWNNFSVVMQSGYRVYFDPRNTSAYIGFRVASVPEPSTGVLVVLACGLMWWKRKSISRVA